LRDDYINALAVVLIGVPVAGIIKALAPGLSLTILMIIALLIAGAVTFAVVRPLRRR
jgi:hypothetical protein